MDRPSRLTPLLLAAFGLALFAGNSSAADSDRPNVLMLLIDDLRPELPVYGADYVQAPNLEALAAESRVFARHYVNTPTCGASRFNLLSGMYPRSGTQRGNRAILHTSGEWAERSLPALMRAGGYRTYAVGKVTHYVGGLAGDHWAAPPVELPGAWNRSWTPIDPWPSPEGVMHGYAGGIPRERGVTPPLERASGPDHNYPDALVADEAVAHLEKLAKQAEHGVEAPWFFAVGLLKPHLPFAAPEKYYQLYQPEDIPPPPNSDKPEGPSSWHASGEFFHNYGHEGGRDPNEDEAYRQELRLAYAACISYMDAQLGRIMAALEESGQADNTIVIAWGDHGYHLGDQAIWGKHCLYEKALHAPLMIRVPGQAAPGELADGLVETVDILPTVLDLTGLPANEHADGVSLAPLVADPSAPGKEAVYGFWKTQETVRTDRWRLIRHRAKGGGKEKEGAGPGAHTFELFDHREDPDEATNLAADRPETVAGLAEEVESLMRKLEAGESVADTVPVPSPEPQEDSRDLVASHDSPSSHSSPQDWPQWRGPKRDGVWRETGLKKRFGAERLDPLWSAPVGGGYSGPVVAEGKVFVTDFVEEPEPRERIHCFRAENGEPLWTHDYPVDYSTIRYQAGPRAAVLVRDGRAYSLGAVGHLHCLDAESGEVHWTRDLDADYGIEMPNWGIAGSPVVEDDLIILTIGGEKASVLALDRNSGEERWRALDDEATYAAPRVIDQGEYRVLIAWTSERIAALDAKTGALHWEYRAPAIRWPIAIADPVVHGDFLVCSEAHQGTRVLKLKMETVQTESGEEKETPSAEQLWHREGPEKLRKADTLHCLISTPQVVDGHIYGVDSRGILRCLELATGEQIWEDDTVVPETKWAAAHLVREGDSDRFWIFNERGELILARLSPEGYRELDRTRVIDPTRGQLNQRGGVVWTHPAYAGRKIYVRNDERLVCVDLAE